MITAFQIAIERAGWYIGSGWHYLLFAAALLFLILKRDDKENRKWLVGIPCYLQPFISVRLRQGSL